MSKHFILVGVLLDPEHISGILGLRWEYSQSITGHHAHTFTPILDNPHTAMFFGSERKLENIEETHMDIKRTCETAKTLTRTQDGTVNHGAVR